MVEKKDIEDSFWIVVGNKSGSSTDWIPDSTTAFKIETLSPIMQPNRPEIGWSLKAESGIADITE